LGEFKFGQLIFRIITKIVATKEGEGWKGKGKGRENGGEDGGEGEEEREKGCVMAFEGWTPWLLPNLAVNPDSALISE